MFSNYITNKSDVIRMYYVDIKKTDENIKTQLLQNRLSKILTWIDQNMLLIKKKPI